MNIRDFLNIKIGDFFRKKSPEVEKVKQEETKMVDMKEDSFPAQYWKYVKAHPKEDRISMKDFKEKVWDKQKKK